MKGFQVSFWTFSLLSQLVPVLLPSMVTNLRKQRDWKELERGAWQRRLGSYHRAGERGGVRDEQSPPRNQA